VSKIFLVVVCMFLVLTASRSFGQKTNSLPEKLTISLDLRKKPLKSVAEEIFKQTGYKVIFDEKWNELPLSGQYTGITLDEFFRRSLRKQNITLFYDEKNHVAMLRFFGDKDFGNIKTELLASGNASNTQAKEDVKLLHVQQRQDLQKYLKDPGSVDPVSGMKLVDIRELHTTQRAELEQLRKDPKTIDPVSGMKNAEIGKLHDVQQEESNQLRDDPKTIDPESSMTIAEIRGIHDVQHAELEQLKKSPGIEVPDQEELKER
jgi:hypothetical protein